MEQIQADFDRIAPFADEGWNHNNHYHGFLLNQLPSRCDHALEIGCGRGAFARLLAERAGHVTALDLSPEMVRIAREQSAAYPNVTFEVADVMAYDLPADHYDCIVSIATLHHLSLELVLAKLKTALCPGGTLLVLDLYQSDSVKDHLNDGRAILLHLWLRLTKPRGEKPPPEARQAWAEHGQHDRYLTVAQVRDVCAKVLPGARVTRHLLWRYSIVWKKPA
jgi:SAM-dependent methyltransferase